MPKDTAKPTHKLGEVERMTIGLYQEKIDYYKNLLTQYVNGVLQSKGLKAVNCSIDLSTGVITEAPPEKAPPEKPDKSKESKETESKGS